MFKEKALAYGELAFFALFIGLVIWRATPDAVIQSNMVAEPTATTTKVALFPDVEIEAHSAYVYDTVTKKSLYEKDAELQWPLASLTKLMSGLVAWELVPNYTLVRIDAEHMREEGDSGLHVDEEWNISNLIDFMLVVSSNDGARALASVAGSQIADETLSLSPEQKFINTMNAKAREIGLRETYFLNQSGLDINKTLAGAYGSAKDTALLVDYILKKNPHLLEATVYENIEIESKYTSHNAPNTNKAITFVPNALGSKTGYTDLSGGNVIVAWNAGIDHPIIISVLGSSYDGRFTDLKTLVEATTKYFGTQATTSSQI